MVSASNSAPGTITAAGASARKSQDVHASRPTPRVSCWHCAPRRPRRRRLKHVASQVLRAFDFWIGEWRVTFKTQEDQPAEGHNSIRRILDGCAIEENWQGGDGS